MMGILNPLLGRAALFGRQDVYLKGFLPLELQPAVEARLARVAPAGGWRCLELSWGAERLTEMLYARLRAGGAGRRGLDDLVEAALEDSINEQLINAADGSPRRLLTLINHLINVHVGHDPLPRPITAAEWQQAEGRTIKQLGAARPTTAATTGKRAGRPRQSGRLQGDDKGIKV
jgi:hypothetical protein